MNVKGNRMKVSIGVDIHLKDHTHTRAVMPGHRNESPRAIGLSGYFREDVELARPGPEPSGCLTRSGTRARSVLL